MSVRGSGLQNVGSRVPGRQRMPRPAGKSCDLAPSKCRFADLTPMPARGQVSRRTVRGARSGAAERDREEEADVEATLAPAFGIEIPRARLEQIVEAHHADDAQGARLDDREVRQAGFGHPL